MVSRAILRRSSRVCHSNELSTSVTQEALLYLLVTNLAARRCTASSSLVAAAVYGSQTVWLYSNRGRINVFYAVCFTQVLLTRILHLKKFNESVAFDVIELM